MNQELINTSEPEYTLDTLPELSIQQATMLNYILEGYNYTQAYRLAKYSADEHAHTAAWCLVMRDPLKSHIDFFMREMARKITPDYIKNKLNYIAEKCASDETVLRSGETAIKAIDVINKMQGNYAQTGNTNIQINTSIEDIRRAKSEYIKDK